jgi:hypothetical protein
MEAVTNKPKTRIYKALCAVVLRIWILHWQSLTSTQVQHMLTKPDFSLNEHCGLKFVSTTKKQAKCNKSDASCQQHGDVTVAAVIKRIAIHDIDESTCQNFYPLHVTLARQLVVWCSEMDGLRARKSEWFPSKTFEAWFHEWAEVLSNSNVYLAPVSTYLKHDNVLDSCLTASMNCERSAARQRQNNAGEFNAALTAIEYPAVVFYWYCHIKVPSRS